MANETKRSEHFSRLGIEGGADGKVYLTDNGRRLFTLRFSSVDVRYGLPSAPGIAPGLPQITLGGALFGVDDD